MTGAKPLRSRMRGKPSRPVLEAGEERRLPAPSQHTRAPAAAATGGREVSEIGIDDPTAPF